MNETEAGPTPEANRATETDSTHISSPISNSSLHQDIFSDSEGLRPIWRVVMYIAMWRFLYFLWQISLFFVRTKMSWLWLNFVAQAGVVATAFLPAILLSKLEDRPFSAYGFPWGKSEGKLFCLGTLWGLGAVTVMMMAMYFTGVFEFGTPVLHGAHIPKFAIFWGAFFLLVGFYEEFLTRGYSLFTLSLKLGFWPSAILLSLGFGALHFENPKENTIGVIGAALIGFFFCLTLRRTGSLWFALGFHATWDWGETFLYSVPDSGLMMPGHFLRSSLHGSEWLTGGTVGPEASVFLFIVLAATWIAFHFANRKVKFPIS